MGSPEMGVWTVIQVDGGVAGREGPILAPCLLLPAGMMYCHTQGRLWMPKTKIAITLDTELVQNLDDLVARRRFANRSQAIEAALAEKLARLAKTRLAQECAKLDPAEEKALAEEGLAGSAETWPEY
jgi:Arc/MetJ-type ribon-helix-helix transcriptional regulator